MPETSISVSAIANYVFIYLFIVMFSPQTSEHKGSMSEFLHSKVCSRVDNNNKFPAIIDLGKDPVIGARLYDLHNRRELYFDDNKILNKLTGRNRFDKKNPNPPHSC